MEKNQKILLFIAGGVAIVGIAGAAMYFGASGDLLKGSFQVSPTATTVSSPSRAVVETVTPTPTPTASPEESVAPSVEKAESPSFTLPSNFTLTPGIYCSGKPNPANAGGIVTWTAYYIDENINPNFDEVDFSWEGDHLITDHGKMVTAVYPGDNANETVTPSLHHTPYAPDPITQTYVGTPCSVTINTPETPEVSIPDQEPLVVDVPGEIADPSPSIPEEEPMTPMNQELNQAPEETEEAQPEEPPTTPEEEEPTVEEEPAEEPTEEEPTEETSPEEMQTPLPETAEPLVAAAPPEPSKCPGLDYPTDIDSHWAEEEIKKLYDMCVLRGYTDGTFRPDQPVLRGEALKIVMSASGAPPKIGCYDADCGSPYMDLDMWHGPWVRGAWDLQLVEGYSATIFGPNRYISRAEAVALVARAFNVPAFPRNCFTPNCGAGHPSNFFLDIFDVWQGKWIRPLWDKGWVRGTGPNTFEPNRPMSRAELVKLCVTAMEASAGAQGTQKLSK